MLYRRCFWFMVPFRSLMAWWMIQCIAVSGMFHIIGCCIDYGVFPGGPDIFMSTPGALFFARWIWIACRFVRGSALVRFVRSRVRK